MIEGRGGGWGTGYRGHYAGDVPRDLPVVRAQPSVGDDQQATDVVLSLCSVV